MKDSYIRGLGIAATIGTIIYYFGIDAMEQNRLRTINQENLDHFRKANRVEVIDLDNDNKPEYIVTRADSTYLLIDEGQTLRAVNEAELSKMTYGRGKTIEDKLRTLGIELR